MISAHPYSPYLRLCHNKGERALSHAAISLLLFYIDDNILIKSDEEKCISLQFAKAYNPFSCIDACYYIKLKAY